jgi:hypothetical protein
VSQEVEYQEERLDHLGIVAGVCQEAGIAEWLDKQARATWLDFCALTRYTHPVLIEQEVDFLLCLVKWFWHTFDDSAYHSARQVCFNLLKQRLPSSEKTLLNTTIIESLHEPVKWVHSSLKVSPQNVLSFREFDIRGEIVYACTFHRRKCFSRYPAI